jgi:hypothetical protein
MKSERFDRMARSMAIARSRRALLTTFAGGMSAAVFAALVRPRGGQAQTCTVDAECPDFQRCASGVCVGALGAGDIATPVTPASVPTSRPNPGQLSQCCQLCARKLEGCTIACYGAPDRANCWSHCDSRFQSCSAACSEPCR